VGEVSERGTDERIIPTFVCEKTTPSEKHPLLLNQRVIKKREGCLRLKWGISRGYIAKVL
jgi:hypothetical protein